MGNTNGQFISSLSSKFHPILEFLASSQSKRMLSPNRVQKCDGNDEEKEEKTQEQPSRKEEERVHKEQEQVIRVMTQMQVAQRQTVQAGHYKKKTFKIKTGNSVDLQNPNHTAD